MEFFALFFDNLYCKPMVAIFVCNFAWCGLMFVNERTRHVWIVGSLVCINVIIRLSIVLNSVRVKPYKHVQHNHG